MATESKPKHVLILGAGITGLQTALSLLTSPTPYQITILATHLPGDLSSSYTSPWAGGHWRSHASLSEEDQRVRGWDARTYEAWKRLLEEGDGEGEGDDHEERVRRIGLGFKESRNFWGKENAETSALDGSGLWWSKPGTVDDFRLLEENERPSGSVMGVRYKSICINVPRYLSYLFERVQSLGARIIKSSFSTTSGLPGAIASAKSILKTHGVGQDIFAVVNCTGLGARHFVGKEESEKLFPIRGQTLLVKGEARMARTYTEFSENPEELLYVIPRPRSDTTILGGCKQVGNWSPEVDEGLSERILEMVKEYKLAEELRMGAEGKFEVLSTQVGFRPGRKGGPRVEVEVEAGGKIGGSWVVHSYGHAGGGYQGSVGCAEAVVGMIGELG